jgi:hypothetical protein
LASASTRVKVTFQGPYALEFSVTFYVAAGIVDPTDAGVQAIVAAINALTNAVAIRIEISASAPHAVTPTTAQIYVNEDKGQFVFLDPEGVPHNFKLPAIKNTLVSSTDNETIVSTGAVATFLAAVSGHAIGPNGGALTAPPEGKRRASRKQLKK